jgi:hypothetical protein
MRNCAAYAAYAVALREVLSADGGEHLYGAWFENLHGFSQRTLAGSRVLF